MGGGHGAISFLKVVANNFDILAGPVVSLAYPLYASVRAIETKSPVDDQQWLTYWILYSMITLFELTFAKLIEWIPIWSYAKLIITCWLVIPYFNGAAYVYEQYVRPLFNKKMVNVWYVPRKKDFFSKPDDLLTAAEQYIQENGSGAFEKLIHRADRETRSPNDNHTGYSYYDEGGRY
ncbi:membrane traffic protein [Lithospermum erythrorhizon]|uniref:HVA22-like protein n=1 Tax=Lithospermum erythrorhizon TaxID=34254 RepID=A0AAV3Q910_LITER